MKKVLLVFGTRPEAVKMCPLYNELKKRVGITVKVCVTGQHREMLDSVMKVFSVEPEYDLSVMKENQTLFDITVNILEKIRPVLDNEKPDIVLVHGDTTTAFAVSLACFYMKIPIGHVEAGLRTYDMYSPFPEEFNRQAIGLTAKYHFAPTRSAAKNLIEEGKEENSIFVTGNTVVDALKMTVNENYTHSELEWASDSRMLFITAHRRENIGEPMVNMFTAIRKVLDEHSDCKAVYPIHKNPAVRKIAENAFDGCRNIHIIEPIDVVDCHNFEVRCRLCLTDSGGIQEECPTFGKPVIVMRNTTERNEGIIAGTAVLAGTEENKIYRILTELLDNDEIYEKMARAINPYGDGHACERIADIIEEKKYVPFELY